MKATSPYLNFAGDTEEAFTFYRSIFGGEFLDIVRFSSFPDNAMGVPEDQLDKIAHIALPLSEGSVLMGTDVFETRQPLVMGNNLYIHLEADSPGEAQALFDGLSAGGEVEMPPQKTEWAEFFGCCKDKFGVQWMVMFTGEVTFSK